MENRWVGVTLNRQLDRVGYETLGELVRDLMAGKIMHMTDDKQIEFMKTNSTGQQ